MVIYGVSLIVPRVVGTQKHQYNYQIHNNDCISYNRQSTFYSYLDDSMNDFKPTLVYYYF